jgi:hypothetical protein
MKRYLSNIQISAQQNTQKHKELFLNHLCNINSNRLNRKMFRVKDVDIT